MRDLTDRTDDLAAHLDLVHERGVAVSHWRSDGTVDATRTPAGQAVEAPMLIALDPGVAPPPTWGVLQDWVRLPASRGELLARAERLLDRAVERGVVVGHVDEDGLLHLGSRRVVLTPLEARLLRLLLVRHGSVVGREEAEAAVWPDGPPSDPRALDNRLRRLRSRLAGLPLHIHTVRGQGFLLEGRAAAR